MEPISILAAILSIASSVKKLTEDKKMLPQDALDLFKKDVASPQQKAFLADQINVEGVISTMSISRNLLEQLLREAEECENKHVQGRAAANGIGAKDKVNRSADQCMCSVLRDVKRYNKSKLPSGPYKAWWDSYGCEK